MTENKKHTGFEERFKESFGDFRQAPDPALWLRIEAGLDRRRKVILFYRLAAAASLLLLFSIAGWFVFRSQHPGAMQPPTVVHEAEQKIPEKEILEVPDRKLAETLKDQIAESPHEPSKPFEPETISQMPAEEKESDVVSPHVHEISPPIDAITRPDPLAENITPEEKEELPLLDPTATIETPDATKPVLVEEKLPDLKEIDLVLQTDDFLPEKPVEGKWQLALGYGTIQGQAVNDQSVAYEATTANFRQDPFSSKLSTETSKHTSIEDTRHTQPLTFGILVNRNLSSSLDIETGLLFTRLKTTSKTSVFNNEFTEYGSELLYVGIPVSIRLNMIRGRRFGMYISQGAVLEKGIRNRYYVSHYAFEVLQHSEDQTYVAEGVQISSLTALGFEFRISNLLSIYAQPGLQVFFLNQTQPYNIRSSSAIWPSFQTGLKFRL
ncbi:MAG TPA: hypothetical protein ENN08_02835 [Bacteroidales bacterium]|nr:hypothetical protein [Bacteroidales bacterium]